MNTTNKITKPGTCFLCKKPIADIYQEVVISSSKELYRHQSCDSLVISKYYKEKGIDYDKLRKRQRDEEAKQRKMYKEEEDRFYYKVKKESDLEDKSEDESKGKQEEIHKKQRKRKVAKRREGLF